MTRAPIALSILGLLVPLGMAAAGARAAAPAAPAPGSDPRAVEFFEKQVRPLLAAECYSCHQGKNPAGGFLMDTRAGFFKGGALGAPVVAGNPDRSLLIEAVRYQGHLKMPPKGRLAPGKVAVLERWVREGAHWPADPDPGPAAGDDREKLRRMRAHWAYQPVRNPAPPRVRDTKWAKNPVDLFVLAKLEAAGLRPAPWADRRTLIRRASFDLTGLPPTPAEIDAFLQDRSPDAWEKVIDRLLASPAYGERWGRHWLDVARYADSNGLDENTAFGNAWRYRDYVIRSLNADKPYDQFVREQVAGDLLPPSSDEQANADHLTATGFLVLGPKVLAEPDKEKMVMDIVDEQIDTLGKAFMGVTLGCARCHDHKFDPFPTTDYYALAGMFKSTRTMETLNTVARAYERPLADAAAVAARQAHESKLKDAEEALRLGSAEVHAQVTGAVVQDLDRYLLAGLQARVSPTSAAADPDRPGAIHWEAERFVRADVKVTTDGSGAGIGIVESAGRSAAYVEYAVEVPADREYDLLVRYASGERRPMRLRIDGTVVRTRAVGEATGGFGPAEQRWSHEGAYRLAAGRRTLRLEQTVGAIPHLDRLALVPLPPPPPDTGRRTDSVEELAAAHRLRPEILRRSAAWLLARSSGDDRVFGPWLRLSSLPETGFAEAAARLAAEWQSGSAAKGWNPLVAEAFKTPPASRAEAAARYQRLFARANNAWNNQLRNNRRPPQRLANGDLEALRQTLYSEQGPFGLSRIEPLYAPEQQARLAGLSAAVEQLKKDAPPPPPMVLAVEDAKSIGNVRVHIRGSHLTLGDEVSRRFPAILTRGDQPAIPPTRSGRLELAEWLTRPDHPLTGRVIVNRVWQHHFGRGIVASADNFGLLGDRPTHPELLDWLAYRFTRPVDQGGMGWSLKRLHKLLMLSAAYGQSTRYDAALARKDPENLLLWRFRRRRLEVEAIRDGMLAASGRLDRTMGGSLLRTPNFGYVTNDQSANAAQYDSDRRSIYLPVIRNAVYDVFQVFDFVEPSFLNGTRSSTTVAPQALFLMNGEFVLEQSRELAKRLLAEPGADAERLTRAHLLVYGRPPAAEELARAQEYLARYEQALAEREKDGERRKLLAWQSYCQVLFASNEFVTLN